MGWGTAALAGAATVFGGPAGAALGSALMANEQAKKQEEAVKKLKKKEDLERLKASDTAARKAGAQILEKTQGSTQSSYMGTYSPASKATLGG